VIPELELPNSKRTVPKGKDKPMKDISTDNHRQRLGIFISCIFAFTLGFIFFALQTNHPLDAEWKELILVLIGALIGNFSKVVDYWFYHKPSSNNSPQE
jgi:hypothetical protein